MVFVIGLPGQYAGWPFYWKIGLLMVGGAQLLYLTIADAPWNVGPGKHAPVLARTLASTGIVAWLVVMYLRTDAAVPRQLVLTGRVGHCRP